MKRIISTFFGLAILCLFAEAQAVPTTVSFAGRLSTTNGPVTGNVNITFTLFNQATNGTSMWTETRNGLMANNGLVYADLGALTTLDEGILQNAPLFLEINVGGEILSPRLPLQSVPYSIRSEIANSADTLGTIAPTDVVTTVTPAANGGVGAARSGNTVTVGLTTCANGQVLKATATAGQWACGADTDTNTTYSAGTNGGLALTGTAFGLTTCANGQVLKATATAGQWACGADTDTNTTYSAAASSGVVLNGTAFGLSTCASGQVLKAGATAGTWACGDDLVGTGGTSQWTSSGADINFTGGRVGVGTTTPARIFEVSDFGFDTQFRVTRGTATIDISPNTGTGASLIRSSKHVMLTSDVASTSGLMVSGAAGMEKVSIGQQYTFTGFGAERLNVAGSVVATAFTVSSSKKFKQNISVVDEAEQDRILEVLRNTDVKHYQYTKDRDPTQREEIGFIAEELPKELLAVDGKSVNLYNTLAYTVAALKAQQREIDYLKAELAKRK